MRNPPESDNATNTGLGLVETTRQLTDNSTTKTPVWERGILTYAQSIQILIYMRMVMPIPVAISAICGITSAIVFSHKKLKTSTGILVIAFNVAEMCKSAAFAANMIGTIFIAGTEQTWSSSYTQYTIYFVFWFPDCCSSIGLIFNCIIAIDRFIVLAFPLQMGNYKVIRHPKMVIAFVVVFVFLWQISLTVFLAGTDYEDRNPHAKFTMDKIFSVLAITIPEEFNIQRKFHSVGSALFRYLPLLMSFFFNFLTIVRLLQHEKRRKSLFTTRTQIIKRQTNITIMVSSLLFTIVATVKPIARITGFLHPTFGDGKQEMYLYTLVHNAAMFVDSMSAAVTLFSCAKMSTQFRACFWQRFAFCRICNRGNLDEIPSV